MAGYLGTLFMANVGMRLLLPPKSEYTKAQQNFGSMVAGIGNKQRAYFSEASRGNIRSLQKTLSTNQKLAADYSSKSAQGTISRLSRTLQKIKQVTKQNVGSITGGSSAAGRSVARLGSITKNMPTGPSQGMTKKSFAERYARDLKAVEVELKKIEIAQAAANRQFVKASETFQNMGQTIIGTFKSALMTSITLLTTLSYSIKGLSQDFATFERELVNANSIWQESNEILYEISDRVIKFGEDYGIAYDNASRVLYQFASAGLEAAEAQAVLNDVLILSMAVQGDANTIGKLTVQTIKGFGLEMSDASMVTDKFAHAINASLIEYQDLASAIKFALPFYAATNQNLDQLLGSIQILTDRALEAGIAGRGLRQALAEFAEGAEDATRKFAQMGVEVVDAQGNFLQLTQIARNFANQIGTGVANDTELLTSLIEDLNIRGATAFIHLVQNVDEFEDAVSELANSQGAAAKMADVQQNSLAMLTQKMRNAMKEVFFLSDAQYVANGTMNAFDEGLKSLVLDFTQLFLVEMPDGSKQLTEFSYDLRDTVLVTLEGFSELLQTLGKQIVSMTQGGFGLVEMAEALFLPLNLVAAILEQTSNILGTGLDANGLIFKFYGLSMVFGSTAAGAIMVGDAVAYMMNKVEEVGEVIGQLITIISLVYTLGGASLVAKGAGAASMRGAGALGTKGVFKKGGISTRGGRNYPGAMDDFLSKKQWHGALDKTDEAFGSVVTPKDWLSRKDMTAAVAGRERLRRQGKMGIGQEWGSLAKGGQQSILSYRSPTDLYRAQSPRFYKPTSLGLRAQQGMLEFADDFAREEGMRRMKWGAVGTYGGYKSWRYDGTQGYASSAMMAQMDSSSYQSNAGQDLYINNANIDSSNFQDLFYASDQLG